MCPENVDGCLCEYGKEEGAKVNLGWGLHSAGFYMFLHTIVSRTMTVSKQRIFSLEGDRGADEGL